MSDSLARDINILSQVEVPGVSDQEKEQASTIVLDQMLQSYKMAEIATACIKQASSSARKARRAAVMSDSTHKEQVQEMDTSLQSLLNTAEKLLEEMDFGG